MYTTIIFDLGGVLFENGTKHIIKHISETYNLDPATVKEVMDGKIGSQYRESEIDKDEFWNRSIKELGINADGNELNTIWLEGYTLIQGTKDIILQLKNDYKVFYLSDNVQNRVEYLEKKYDFLKMFDGGVFSYDVGVRKPNEKIYTITLEKAQCEPEEALFVDDKESALQPAKKLGIGTVLFTSANQLKNDLVVLGVLK